MPSATESSTAAIVNVASDDRAGMAAVAGTVAAFGALLLKSTTKGVTVGVLRVTLPVAVPPFSEIDDGLSVNARLDGSSSTIVSGAEAEAKPAAEAEMSNVRLPSATELSTAAMLNEANDAPAGIVTLAGTVAELGSLLLKLTTTADTVSELRVTLPVAVPPFSEIDDELRVNARLATSSSTIVSEAESEARPVAEAEMFTV